MSWAWDSSSFFTDSARSKGSAFGDTFGGGSPGGAFGIPTEVFATNNGCGKQVRVQLRQAAAVAAQTISVEEREEHRVIHRIQLDAISHNFSCIETAAAGQRCSVFVVVKGDGYGHSSINSALHLADYCGADAFAVATLQEGIILRKAFQDTLPGQYLDPEGKAVDGDSAATPPTRNSSKSSTGGTNATGGTGGGANALNSMFSLAPEAKSSYDSNIKADRRGKAYRASSGDSSPDTADTSTSTATTATTATSTTTTATSSSTNTPITKNGCLMRPSHVRIHVLGPPVGYPRCFDDYYHHDIEVMVTGPEVAASLLDWVKDSAARRRHSVEKIAKDVKAKALRMNDDENSTATSKADNTSKHISATLSNVSGRDLAKELRKILITQKKQEQQKVKKQEQPNSTTVDSSNSGESPRTSTSPTDSQQQRLAARSKSTTQRKQGHIFAGIEAVAKDSRTREQAESRIYVPFIDDSEASFTSSSISQSKYRRRKCLRWHALVDTGMGRLGFKTQSIANKEDDEMLNDIVDIIRKLVEVEYSFGSPIEFYGMCTHMADATNKKSQYTKEQIGRFKCLLRRIRAVGISVPTVSTDNSAALLTPEFTHFDPNTLLSQPSIGAPTRGFVRTGGAIFGQRPAFKQLRAVSTLLASVRHIAVLKKGESVGYDRAYIASSEVRIATLTIGFADGYPRDLGNGIGKVEIRKQLFPIVGNVCMDMVMVELGKVHENRGSDVVVGDTAVLWGPSDENSGEGLVKLKDIANVLKTTQSALTCGLDTSRVRRQFV